jgi:hypothetical protein
VGAQHRKRISTSTLNMVVRDACLVRQPPIAGGRAGRIYYATQVGECAMSMYNARGSDSRPYRGGVQAGNVSRSCTILRGSGSRPSRGGRAGRVYYATQVEVCHVDVQCLEGPAAAHPGGQPPIQGGAQAKSVSTFMYNA